MLDASQSSRFGKRCACVLGGSVPSNPFSVLVVRSSFFNVFLVLVHITFSSLTLLSVLHSDVLFLI